ncbi:hypothetical protein ABZ478_35215 [Streptomyces sp. NPDC005706]|uniref:hypothetical protein n=1 Tax=Streptomyces sp. NPDC005706 TaxID=3157169 RepID=UPI0033EEFF8A
MIGQQDAVGGAVDVFVEEVCGGMGLGQGEVAEVGGEGGEFVGGNGAAVGGQRGGQVGRGFVFGEQAHWHQASTAAGESGFSAADGDQGAAVRADWRPQVAQVCGVGKVVQHDEPPALVAAGLRLRPDQERRCGPLRVGRVGAEEIGGRLGMGGDDGGAGGCGDPPQQIHFVPVPCRAGVVGRHVCLADPAHVGQYLAQHDRAALGHGLL